MMENFKKLDLKILKEAMIFIIAVVVILVSGVLVFMPNLQRAWGLQSKLSGKKKELSQLTQKANHLEGINLYEIEMKQKNIAEALPAEKDVEVIFKNLKLLAGKAGVALTSMNVAPGEIATAGAVAKEAKGSKEKGEKTQKESFEVINYSVQAKGKLDNLKDFFELLHQTGPAMVISGVSLNLPSDSESLIPVNLTIKTYYLGFKNTPSGVKTPISQATEEEDKVYQEKVLKLQKFY